MTAALLAGALLSIGACLPAPSWRAERVGGARFEVPAQWRVKPLPGAQGASYSHGRVSIQVARHGIKGSPRRSVKEYLDAAAPGKTPERFTLAGRAARRASSEYRLGEGGDDGIAARSAWIYEEIVVVPAREGFWSLEFRSRSSGPRESPRAAEVWERFLKSFRPD